MCPDWRERETWACGPGPMLDSAEQHWQDAGIGEQVHALALAAYDQMIGLDLADVAVDGCITKAPCGRGLRRARSRWTGAKAA